MCASSRGFLLLFAMRIGPLDGAKTVAHGRVEKKATAIGSLRMRIALLS